MSAPRTGGLRRRNLPQRPSQQPQENSEARQNKAVGQAAPLGAALSLHAAPSGAAVGNCDDQRARIAAGRVAFRARQRAIQASSTAPPDSGCSETPPKRGLAHSGRQARGRGRGSYGPKQSRSKGSKKPRLTPEAVPNPSRQISVRTNLPNRLPILSIEIALVENALSEFLSSRVAANDNEDGVENE